MAEALAELKQFMEFDRDKSINPVIFQETDKDVNVIQLSACPYERVIVYQDQAEVHRIVKFPLRPGENDITLLGLPSVVDKDSIRIESKSVCVINDVVYIAQYSLRDSEEEEEPSSGRTEEADTAGSAALRELNQLKREMEVLEARVKVLKQKLRLMDALSCGLEGEEVQTSENAKNKLQTASNPQNLAIVLKFLEFSCHKKMQIEGELHNLEEQIRTIKSKITAIELNISKSGKAKEDVLDKFIRAVKVMLEGEGSHGVFILSYIVTAASWSPIYHLRVSTRDQSMQVLYFGMITQHSGEDWINTAISLSTASPSKGGSPPKLQPVYLTAYRPVYIDRMSKSLKSDGYIPTIFDGDLEQKECSYAPQRSFRITSLTIPQPTYLPVEEVQSTVQVGMFIQTFSVPRPASIPSDGTEHKVSITVLDLNPEFENFAVPEENSFTYLAAKVNNTSAYPLLPGPTSVFLDNNFISKSNLRATSPGEEFICSLGVDPLVRVTFKPGEGMQSQHASWLSRGSTTEHFAKLTTIKNTKSTPITITVTESVPLSQDERTKVVLLEPNCKKPVTKYPLQNGTVELTEKHHLEWRLQVPPNATAKFALRYLVEYPI